MNFRTSLKLSFATLLLCWCNVNQGQIKDILEVARVQVPFYSIFKFSPTGEYAYGYNESERTLSVIQTKNVQVLRVLPFGDNNIENIYISPNNKMMLATTPNHINLYSVDSAQYLFSFLRNEARNIAISHDSRYYATTNRNNVFDIVDMLTREGTSYNVPTHIEGKAYKSNIEKCIFSKKYDKLYLVDVGYAEEISTYKTGLHINVIPFDLVNKHLMKPIELFISQAKNYSSSDFTEISVTPNGRFIIIALKNKIIYYNIVTRVKKEIENIEIVKTITYDSSGKYMLTSGLSTTTLWEITEEDIFRQLKNFIGGSTTLSFTPDNRYVITLTPERTRLIAWDIKEALLIRSNPSLYIQRSSQKYSKLAFIEWLKKQKGESNKKYAERMSPGNQKKQSDLILKESINKYCKEVFGVGADYLILNKGSSNEETITLQTDGFNPLHFNIVDSTEHQKFIKYFLGGFYRWKNAEFKISKNEVLITKILLHMNYNKIYQYNIVEDVDNNHLLNNILEMEYNDYNMEEDKLK